MELKSLINELKYEIVQGNISTEIKGIAYDSREVKDGYLFICIKGFTSDGHNYIENAVNAGASAVVIEDNVSIPENITAVKTDDTRKALAKISASFFGNPSEKIKIIGVTGTNGKTTTTYMIKAILEYCGYRTSLLGTIYNIINGQEVKSKNTTPESYDLQKMFKDMVKSGTEYCVMEVSSHSLELKRVEGCIFSCGIFTNLTRDHLDFHKTFDNYFNAKMKLFNQSKIASINIDDSYSGRILENISIPVITYSEKKDADVKAENVEIASNYSAFDLIYKNECTKIKIPIPGRFNVYNALAAISACLNEGIGLDKIKSALENFTGVPGRSEVIDSGRGFAIIIDYAHTPDGLENILNTVREYTKGNVITLFGCGGDRDKTKRPMMGEIAGKLSDICIVTSDNPRTEDPDKIIEDILPGIKRTGVKFEVNVNRREAIKRALLIADKDDVVVIAGKGHETYQILKEGIIHFDEREIINEILKTEI